MHHATRSSSTHTVAKLAGLMGLACSLAGVACQGTRGDSPPIHLNPNMDFQQKFEAQEVNEFFDDGRAARLPVKGTIARGHLQHDDHLFRGIDLEGNLVETMPAGMEVNGKLLDRGRARYEIYCAPCHDQTGRGHGMATRRGGGFSVQPASFHQEKLRSAPVGYIYHVIANGRGTMLGYASQIPVEDRWAIAAWVRVLQTHGMKKGWDDTPANPDAMAGGAKSPVAALDAGRQQVEPAPAEVKAEAKADGAPAADAAALDAEKAPAAAQGNPEGGNNG